MKDAIQHIKNEAISLAIGETTQVECCFCGKADKLSITRLDEGIVYNCWSAMCSGKGFIGSMPSQLMPKVKKTFTAKPFTGETQVISRRMYDRLFERYYLSATTIDKQGWKEIVGRDALVMPLVNSQGYEYGNTTKFFDIAQFHPGKWTQFAKSIHYLETQEVMLHYASAIKSGPMAVLVEDVLSAARIQQMSNACQGIALLGTDLNDEKVKNILNAGYSTVIIAFDPDATTKAMSYVNKYALFFRRLKAVALTADPKDLPDEELHEQLFGDE